MINPKEARNIVTYMADNNIFLFFIMLPPYEIPSEPVL